ncbi:MAG TPA: HSP20 family small heat-shock protein [Ferruginibacter sp.]|jgi:HSP20 family protein|nr:HSP20 family small heat-shock protein [Ferruginibacter sp.]
MKTIVKNGTFGVDAFPKSINELFDTLIHEANSSIRGAAILPKTDIAETENSYELTLGLPGIKKEDIQIEVVENKITIKGERKRMAETENKKYHKQESQYGIYERSFVLPKNAYNTEIGANHADGVLTISIPKSESLVSSRKIEIK